jgi:hypothetical protein
LAGVDVAAEFSVRCVRDNDFLQAVFSVAIDARGLGAPAAIAELDSVGFVSVATTDQGLAQG